MQIQQQRVIGHGTDRRIGFAKMLKPVHRMARLAHMLLHRGAQIRLVLDQKNSHSLRPCQHRYTHIRYLDDAKLNKFVSVVSSASAKATMQSPTKSVLGVFPCDFSAPP